MNFRQAFFFLFLLVGSFLLTKFQYNKLELIALGKEIYIDKGFYTISSKCDYVSKDIPVFLKFDYNNKSYSIRIKSKDCKEITDLNKLKLLTNDKENQFIYDIKSVKIELLSSITLFLVLSFCFYNFLIKNKLNEK